MIFKNEKEIRVLSRILFNDNLILKNQTFSNTDIKNKEHIKKIIENLKIVYEDYWKNFNQVNTSIKLTLNVRVNNLENLKISNFEKILDENDLIYDFSIIKFNKKFIYYQIIFNGTPSGFLKSMGQNGLAFDTQNKIWILQ